MVYTKIKLHDCKDHYYMVTMLSKESSRQRCMASGYLGTTNSCSTSHQEILDEESVDISVVASKINQEYGINITEKRWLESHQATGCCLEQNWRDHLHPTREDNDVAGCLLLLSKNLTLIPGITEAVVASNVSANQDYPTGALADEEIPPTMEETVHELHSSIGIMDEELLPPFGVVVEEKTNHVATPNLNDITSTSRQKLDQKVETHNPDQV